MEPHRAPLFEKSVLHGVLSEICLRLWYLMSNEARTGPQSTLSGRGLDLFERFVKSAFYPDADGLHWVAEG